jgi:CRISPR/Cas system CMR-associated protein Cmr1 (group 7 of RAMP superfamily)
MESVIFGNTDFQGALQIEIIESHDKETRVYKGSPIALNLDKTKYLAYGMSESQRYFMKEGQAGR